MDQVNVLRLLTLYKQHYRDRHDIELNGQYSSWGYYDSMKVEKVRSFADVRILESKGNINITDLWYKMAEEDEQFSGRYGRLYIGLFGFEDDEQFWNENRMFLCVVFLQVNAEEKNIFMKDLKKECAKHVDITSEIYRTLDNMDYVCCIKSDKYSPIINCIEMLRGIESILYVRSIVGIESQLLKEEDKLCQLAEEPIEEIRIQMATRDLVTAQNWWNMNCSHIDGQYALTEDHVLGHHNIEICLKDVTMRTAAELMIEHHGVTHTSKLYGEIIYNIKTMIIHKKENVLVESEKQTEKTSSEEDVEPDTSSSTSWCEKQIVFLREKINKAREYKDEALYSYYLAIIRSLNMLAQYEQFSVSKELFYMIAPAFEMFLEQLNKIEIDFDAGINDKKKTIYGITMERLENVKETISNFLETVNEIIYHAVHTDQMFLAIPGYNGVIYDVPLKLCLLYLAYAKEIGKIIHDNKDNAYRCYIIPVVNAKPITTLTRFDGSPKQRLIAIQTSQRSLYMPRAFCIIVTHELAHYIGDQTRQRRKRLSEYVYIYAYTFSELIFESGKLNGKVDHDLLLLVKYQCKNRVQQYIVEYLNEKIKKVVVKLGEDYTEKEVYHFSVLEPDLKKVCLDLLRDEDGELNNLIYDVNGNIIKRLSEGNSELWADLRKMHSYWTGNIKCMAAEGSVEAIMVNIIKEFREIYSDIVAVEILELGKDWRYYLETFSVSEGVRLDQPLLSEELILRVALVVKAVNDHNQDYKKNWDTLVSSDEKGFIETLARIVDQWIKKRTDVNSMKDNKMHEEQELDGKIDVTVMYNLDATWNHMLNYAEVVYEAVKDQIKEPGKCNSVKNLFEFFKVYDKGKDKSYADLFAMYDEMINSYCSEVESIFSD